MKKVLIITGDAKKVEGFAHEQRYRFKRDIEWSKVEFFGNFSCSFKRISFKDGSQLVVVNF